MNFKLTAKMRWYKLSSKSGQKEKERGEIQVSIRFVRNNLTASMFDLSSKEKHRSALDKLKDKVKGKKKQDRLVAESASAIVSSSVGQITSDEELSERGTPEKKPKRSFFSKPKLHRSSLTKSNSSLSSQHSVRSLESVDSSTGVASLGSPKAMAAPADWQHLPSESDSKPFLAKVLTHKRTLSDEVNQAMEVGLPHLAPKTSPMSRSLLCINGSHVYSEEHSPKNPSSSFLKSPHLCLSLQNVAGKAEEPRQQTPVGDPDSQQWKEGRPEVRGVPPAITVNNEGVAQDLSMEGRRKEGAGGAQGTRPVYVAAPFTSAVEPSRSRACHETKKVSVFPFGSDTVDSEARRSRTPSPVRKSSSLTRPSGWFLKETSHKPSVTFGSQGTPDALSTDVVNLASEVTHCSSLPAPRVSPLNNAAVSPASAPQPPATSSPSKGTGTVLWSAGVGIEVGGGQRGPWPDYSNNQVPSDAPKEDEGEEKVSSTLAQVGGHLAVQSQGKGSSSSMDWSGGWVQDGEPLVGSRMRADWAESMHWTVPLAQGAASPVLDPEQTQELGQSVPYGDPEVQSGPLPGGEAPRGHHLGGHHLERPPAPPSRAGGEPPVTGGSAILSPIFLQNEDQVPNDCLPASEIQLGGSRCESPARVTGEGKSRATEECPEGTGGSPEGTKGRTGGSPEESGVSPEESGVSPEESGVSPKGTRGRTEGSPEETGGRPKAVAGERNLIAAPCLNHTDPAPPKPPRSFECNHGDEADKGEAMEERQEILGCPAALQLHQRLEQKASLVLSSPAAEANPEQPETASTPPAVRPSADAEPSASELNPNEIPGVELYKTCLSTLSAEVINTSTGSDGNSNKLDVFQQAGSWGLIEFHHLVEVQPATLWANSPEAASLGEDRLPAGLEVSPEEEGSSARSAVQESGEKTWEFFPGEADGGAGREGGLRTLSHSEQAPARNAGRGMGPLTAGMETAGGRKQRAGGPEAESSLSGACNHGQEMGKANGPAPLSAPSANHRPWDCRKLVAEEAPAEDSWPPSAALSEQRLSFRDLHRQSVPHAFLLPDFPLAFSTPHPVAATNPRATDLPSPIPLPSASGDIASQHSPQSGGPKPREPRPVETPAPKQQQLSPLPEKPITATAQEVAEKKSSRSCLSSTLSSGLEKLKNVTTGSISPIKVSGHGREAQEAVKESKMPDPATHYYHLTHDELIKKILQQELELQKKEEHVRDLEEYIDLLLVQIMEQNPSILQSVSEKMKSKTATD
ncbi:rab11 family-interacting protein 1-like isoform X2 [Narcine bancroftii]|uniref:rab11 family-interacting protein 1-like isoform X2 n=1 Tax=Narcine bancroftii TaxID=1343680 RepID=UPI003831B690